MANGKELYHCEGCKKEFWLEKEEARKRGSLCPNKCARNKQIFLGETDEEIKKRRKEFLGNKGFDFEVNPDIDDSDDGMGGSRRTGGSLEKNNYFFD